MAIYTDEEQDGNVLDWNKQNEKTITFYKNNRIDGEFHKPINDIISGFIKSDEYKYINDMPFERLILNHLMGYGSFGQITDKQWNELNNEWRVQR